MEIILVKITNEEIEEKIREENLDMKLIDQETSQRILANVRQWLQSEVKDTEEYKNSDEYLYGGGDDVIIGRGELAESLLSYIEDQI
tara:strand:- start:331 stop:591 length:261 start_codon:yes stop_codon:yes gene_type:complete